MPENQNNQELNKPDSTQENQNNQIAKELLEKLGIPVQQPAPPATTPTACADSTAGGVSETRECASAHSPVSPVSAFGVRSSNVAGDVAGSQLPQTSVSAAQPVGGSFEVNCVPCGGCCGNRRGRRLPGRVYDFVAWVAGVRGVAMCQVVNEFPELFCKRLGRRGHGVNRVKELERLLSREGEYKASYVLERLRECLNDAICWRYLRLGVEGWYRVVHLLANRAPGDVDAYFAGLIRGLGFSGVAEASRYLRLVDQGLIDFNYTNRGRGFRDVLSVRCRICGEVIDVTGPLPSVLARLIRHFRVEHGLKAVSDVEKKVKESEGVSDFDVLRRGKRYFDGLMSELANAFSRLGWIEDGRCMLCKGELKSGPYHVVLHFAGWHSEQVKQLLKGIGAPQVGEQPNVEKVLEDAAREVSQRLGIEFELADGAIKSIYYIVNSRVRGAWGIDLVVKELADVDPGLADKLKESGRDIRQVALAVVEVLRARSLIDEKHTTGESQVNPDKQSSMGQGNAQHQQSQALTQVHEAKGQVSLKSFMPQEGSRQASRQVGGKPAGGGVDVSEILRPEVVLKPINDPEALRRAVREFFEPWIIEEPDPRWLRVKRKYTMKLVEAVDKAKSIEELNEMIARIEEEESQELAQLEQELGKNTNIERN
ncbi:MAG: hypothetical protein RXQ94_08675 [Caldivirga sp.]